MHELSRRAYLASMGVDNYVSRGALPGAAPTQRLVLVPGKAPTVEPATADRASEQGAEPSIHPVFSSPPTKKNTFLETANKIHDSSHKTRGKPAAIPSFSIAAISCGGYLWLEEVSRNAISPDQVHLIQAMSGAMGRKGSKPDVARFDWPIHRNAQLDQGEEAAQAGLGGFVQRRVQEGKCRGVILLGSAVRHRLNVKLLNVECSHAAHSTAQMLQDARLKKPVWQDLQQLAAPH